MERAAANVKNVKISDDQSYEWGVVESGHGKIKRYACIDYFFHAEIWDRVVKAMRDFGMRSVAISFYKGATIDEANKTVNVRGEFIRDFVGDKHRAFWHKFLKCDKNDPRFSSVGKMIKLPIIAGDNDSLNFFVGGQNVAEILVEPEST